MKSKPHHLVGKRHSGAHFCIGMSLALLGMAFSSTPVYATTFALGTTTLLEGPGAGNDSVILAVNPETDSWQAAANAAWLHLSVDNQSGTGSRNIVFGYDANPGVTRDGTITFADQTLTVTQAGSTYVAATGPLTALFAAQGQGQISGVAVDGAGNVYIADNGNAMILKWTPTDNTATAVVSSGLNSPYGVAVDSAGNVYIADTGHSAIKKWTAANNTVTTLVATGLFYPYGVAVDGAGNVYIADTDNNAIKKWTAANNTVTTLVAYGLGYPQGLAVDGAGNVYIADTFNSAVKKWTAANNTVTTLVASGLSYPYGVAVDGAGNVYIADSYHFAVKQWTAANGAVTTLVPSGLNTDFGVAVDLTGNVYIADSGNHLLKELPHAFVDAGDQAVSASAGNATLPPVQPVTGNLLDPFTPTSDQPWLTLGSVTNGTVSFSFCANSGTNRTAHVTIFGQSITVTQAAPVAPSTLVSATLLGNGLFQFAFSNSNPGASFTVLSATNMLLPLTNWTVVGTPTNTASGLFQFTTPLDTNESQRFYRVRSP